MVDYLLDQFVQQIDYSVDLFDYDFVLLYLHLDHSILHCVLQFHYLILNHLQDLYAHYNLLYSVVQMPHIHFEILTLVHDLKKVKNV